MNPRTPGPWALRGFQIRAENGQGAHVATYQIAEADGRLLAAAPDLLAALLRLLREQPEPMAPVGRLYEVCAAAREAIAKAGCTHGRLSMDRCLDCGATFEPSPRRNTGGRR